MIFALSILLFGVFFCWAAFVGWRHRREDSISLLEASILTASGEEPLPLTLFDRLLQKFQLIMMTIFGPPMVFLGGYGLLTEIGVL
ncbi:hypothetical protein [Erythrobacter rubeus]|uniref:Uncharacterized protein n=1 Tax=Erythrobacter rubeus TaxID=2760803 RepID=A0ABR8KRU3_9SPHN|nr:hypothetical protein [Erythrobacter rubeus]MBD2840841.1 hypothetical protein [Erythrobacter rubeus]